MPMTGAAASRRTTPPADSSATPLYDFDPNAYARHLREARVRGEVWSGEQLGMKLELVHIPG